MIIRKLHLLIAAHLIYTSLSQNARSYDTNDWIPITQKTSADSDTPKKATGRVLNLDTPTQKFFPDEFLYKQNRPNFQSRPKQKDRYNVPKYENTYKFDLPPSHPQNGQSQKYQYTYPQEIQLPNYQQPPPLDIYRPPPHAAQYVSSPQIIRTPSPNQLSSYQQYQQLPAGSPLQTNQVYNTTFYQTINPQSINKDLASSLTYENTQRGQENQIVQNLPNTESFESPAEKNNGKDNIQLVYVPLENLKGNQPLPQYTQNIYRQIESPSFEKTLDKPHRLAAIEQDFIQQALQATKLQEDIRQGNPLLYQITTTTQKPVKIRKPHQPPLAVYLEGENQEADITDVLSALQEAKTIAVRDSILPGSPQIFIGPSSLESPEYTKFPLPYLNTIDGNRINKKIDGLPFFVAPLSFKTPPGYSKIPLPAPHVGSVVISHKEDLHGKRSTPRPNQYQTESAEQFGKEDIPVTHKVETLTQQPYIGQNYYDQFVTSPQPQLLQFAVNDQSKQYNVPGNSYNSQLVGNEYNLALKSQPELTTQIKDTEVNANSKILPESVFHYNYEEEAKPTLKNNVNPHKSSDYVNYNIPSKSLSYTGPQTYDQDNKRPNQQQYTDFNNAPKENNDQYSLKEREQVRYEPIATTFDSNPQKDKNINVENAHKQKSNTYVTEKQEKPHLPDISPLELAINEFELHQINTQLEEKPRVKNQYNYKNQGSSQDVDTEYQFDPELHRFAGTPASILRDTYETTTRPTTKPRQRIRTRPKATTLPPPEVETYTVLEDFSVKQKPQQSDSSKTQYTTRQKDMPTEQIPIQQKYSSPNYFPLIPKSQYSEPSNVQYTAYQEDIQTEQIPIQNKYGNPSYSSIKQKPQYYESSSVKYTPQQDIQTEKDPSQLKYNTPNYVSPQHTSQYSEKSNVRYASQQENPQTQENYRYPSYLSSITEIENIPTKVYNLNVNKNSPLNTESPAVEHSYTLNQNLMDQQILQSGIRPNSPIYEQQGQFEVDPHHYSIQSNTESTKGNLVDYKKDPSSLEQERLNEYESSFDDPSVRTLLVPKLLVPTTTNDDVYTGPTYLPTTEKIRSTSTTSTTERPIKSTTQPRVRSRTRGGNRFNTHSTTKKPLTRRRPTRVTTEKPVRDTQDSDYGNKNSNTHTKSRFRTRGRTTPNSINERQSTTGNEVRVSTSESSVEIRTHPDGSQSYMQYEHSVEPQKVIQAERNQDFYSSVYPTSTRPIIQYDNTGSTPKPNINVQISHPEEHLEERVRIRGRFKDRPKSSTTTERVVTRRITSKPAIEKEEKEEEFYGFFRQPDFGTPAETRIEVPTTTPIHRLFAYQTPSQHGEDYQLNFDNTQVETSTVTFVGEIVPKYTTSKEVITETETPRPRIRTRIRTPQRKFQTSQNQEPSSRRANIIRSRGKTHFKLPETLKKDKEDDDDVEGGNYPAQFLQGRRGITTPTPNFQITVAPDDEDDQALNPSLYRPSVVASPQEWHDASEYDLQEEKKTHTNVLDAEENSSKFIEDQPNQPYALPVKLITEKIKELPVTTPPPTNDEIFNESTKQIEEQFEGISKFDNDKFTEIITETPKKHKGRKGVWKLVKHHPVDRLETSESQNYLSVLNSYHDIQKVKGEFDYHQKPLIDNNQNINDPFFKEEVESFQTENIEIKTEKSTVEYPETTTILPEEEHVTTLSIEDKTATTTASTITKKEEKEDDFLDSIYEMFGILNKNTEKSTHLTTSETETTTPITTTLNPTFPEELTESPLNSSIVNAKKIDLKIETTTFPLEDFFTTPQLEAKHDIKTSNFDVPPWDMHEVRTSTSTEISHETEICYKGRCIRSYDRKKSL